MLHPFLWLLASLGVFLAVIVTGIAIGSCLARIASQYDDELYQ